MLNDTEGIKKLARRDMSLAKKVVHWLDDYIGKLKAAIKDTELSSVAEAFLAHGDNTMKEIRDRWYDALADATDNYMGRSTMTEADTNTETNSDISETAELADETEAAANEVESDTEAEVNDADNKPGVYQPTKEEADLDTQIFWELIEKYGSQNNKDSRKNKKASTEDGEVRYSLRKYTQKELNNWSSSKRIVIYENDDQYRWFIRKSLSDNSYTQKMYFGAISQDLAALIKINVGLNIENFNCTISANEIRKIMKDHGNDASEAPRGQRAITENDFVNIPHIIQAPEKIVLSPNLYNGKPVINFTKNINGKVTISAVVSDKHLDLFVQTAYASIKKGNLATPTGEQAPINTPEASRSTVSNERIPQKNSLVKLDDTNTSGDSSTDDNKRSSKRISYEESDRTIIANALESVANTEEDKALLRRYKDKLGAMEKKSEALGKKRQELQELRFTPGKRTPEMTAKITSLSEEVKKLENSVRAFDDRLLRMESTQFLRDLVASHRKKGWDAAAKKYREKISEGVENRGRKAGLERAEKLTKELIKMLTTPTDKKHVPDGLAQPLARFLDSLEYAPSYNYRKDGSVANQKTVDKKSENWSSLFKDVKSFIENNASSTNIDLDSDIAILIDEFLGQVEGLNIYELSSDQLKIFNQILTSIKKSIDRANKIHVEGRNMALDAFADGFVENTKDKLYSKSGKKIVEDLKKLLNYEIANAYYYADMIGPEMQAIIGSIGEGVEVRGKKYLLTAK